MKNLLNKGFASLIVVLAFSFMLFSAVYVTHYRVQHYQYAQNRHEAFVLSKLASSTCSSVIELYRSFDAGYEYTEEDLINC